MALTWGQDDPEQWFAYGTLYEVINQISTVASSAFSSWEVGPREPAAAHDDDDGCVQVSCSINCGTILDRNVVSQVDIS